MHSIVPTERTQYYQGKYWNDLPQTVRELNRRATGDPESDWMLHLLERWGKFDRALVLACGNGWVERELLRLGVIETAIGVDVSEELLSSAREAARSLNGALTYHAVDLNVDEWPDGEFDLIVNHAALHHVAYLDRAVRTACQKLSATGKLVSWDYTGPHRNQYPAGQWQAVVDLNSSLPSNVSHDLGYPHLPTMLADDPTEAVHSELIVEHLDRYFDREHFAELGGALAYPILTHNERLFEQMADHPSEAEIAVERVLEADLSYVLEHPGSSLFTYGVFSPRKHVLADVDQLSAWTRSEDAREAAAQGDAGKYYRPTVVGELYERLEVLERQPPAAAPTNTGDALARTRTPDLLRVVARRLRERFVHTLKRRPRQQ
jgi:SAM-dependent methyltransferase